MSIEQLKKEAAALSFEEQGQLAAYLVQLRNRQDPRYQGEMRQRIEDQDRAHWVTPEQFGKKLDELN
jgi:hypothetical protein